MTLAQRHATMRRRWLKLAWLQASRTLTQEESAEFDELSKSLGKLSHFGRPKPKCKECGR